jgi:hypothetical protein
MPVQWKPSCPMGGRTDRHDEANNRFAQFCERSKSMKRQLKEFQFGA